MYIYGFLLRKQQNRRRNKQFKSAGITHLKIYSKKFKIMFFLSFAFLGQASMLHWPSAATLFPVLYSVSFISP